MDFGKALKKDGKAGKDGLFGWESPGLKARLVGEKSKPKPSAGLTETFNNRSCGDVDMIAKDWKKPEGVTWNYGIYMSGVSGEFPKSVTITDYPGEAPRAESVRPPLSPLEETIEDVCRQMLERLGTAKMVLDENC